MLRIICVCLAIATPVVAQIAEQVHIDSADPVSQLGSRAAGVVSSLNAHGLRMRFDVNLVMVPVTVVDAMNRPVMGLERQNFSVFEDKEPQQIRYFSSEDAPISVGFILDLSGTMADKMELERAALAEFFNNSNTEDDYFVITFAERPKVLADSTKSTSDIMAKLAFAKPAGFTSLLDAIYMGVTKLRRARYQRRALVIISDGIDNASRYSLKDIKSMVEESDVGVYAIGLFDDRFPVSRFIEVTFGKRLLSQVTTASGGRTIPINDAAKLPAAAAALSLELRNQYVLGYRPTRAMDGGKWRKIRVQVKSDTHGGQRLTSFYKKGYAGPQQ